MNKFYITTPIYYVNDIPHIGHAYTTVAADILSRWNRIKGNKVFFLTGTDEHGAKIAEAAQKKCILPQELCNSVSREFLTAWQELSITNDAYIRTTDQKHIKTVELLLTKMFEAGDIYKKKYEGLYCVGCEKFLAEEDLDENKCCPDHKHAPKTHSEENYFFKLSKYKDRLISAISDENSTEHFKICPEDRKKEILGKLQKVGLEDISISRASLEWGIPVPFDKSQTVYVWVDALINYLSGAGYSDNQEMFKKYWPCDVHLMAKDILWFHSVIWPAVLMSCGLALPKKVFAHGFFTIDGNKMSKTLGNVIKPADLTQKFGVDASRYLLLSLFPFGNDGDISWKGLTDRYNTDLANNLGNLVSRTLTMVEKYFEGKVPAEDKTNSSLTQEVKNMLEDMNKNLENLEFHTAIEKLQKAIDLSNRFIQSTAPWKMAKENPAGLPAVIFPLLQNIALTAIYLYPFMPEVSSKIWNAAGCTDKIEERASKYFNDKVLNFPASGSKINSPGILFPRIIIK